MIPAIGRTKTTGAELETVPRETPTSPLTPPEGVPSTSADVGLLADAGAEARRWAPTPGAPAS